jgi:hypothetical protein
VLGVSIILVRAMSMGARMRPARPEAPTAAKRDIIGWGEEMMSRPPTAEGMGMRYAGEAEDVERPGSGMPRKAQIRERVKAVRVERSTEWMNVLLVPFQIPQAPSVVQR